MLKHYRIAGITVEMDTFGRTEKQAEPYLCEKTEQADITMVQAAEHMQKKYPYLTLDESEHIITCKQFYHYLLDFRGMMLHASAVVMDGFAFLFSADSGTGKSTHTKLWQELYGYDKVLMLNDDKPALRLEGGRWYAYGTPWSGKTDQNLNMRVPLGGICLLERGQTNEIVPYCGMRVVYDLLQQTMRPATVEYRAMILDLLDNLIENIPVWKLKCNMDLEAARVSHDAMYKAAKEKWSE
jgi:hypothetical protein